MFVFLLPSDMGGVARLVLQSLRRKQRRAMCEAAADAAAHAEGALQPAAQDESPDPTAAVSAAAVTASPDGGVPSSCSFAPAASPFCCGCSPSVRTRVVSWTFALPADVAMSADDEALRTPTTATSTVLAVEANGSATNGAVVDGAAATAAPWRVSLRPTRSSALRSAHTKLHVYDLCACTLRRPAETQGIGADVDAESKARNGQVAPPPPLPELGHAAEVARAFAEPADGAASAGASSVPWGHGLNSVEALQRRWAAAMAAGHRGLFVEADLRIRPAALRRAAEEDEGRRAAVVAVDCAANPAAAAPRLRHSIDDVILAHDSGVDGESFRSWFAALCALSHSGNTGAGASVIGLKLDFKCLEAVAPVLAELRAVADAAATTGGMASATAANGALSGATDGGGPSRSYATFPLPLFLSRPSFLWLNADVLPGPGCDQTGSVQQQPAIDAAAFLAQCQSHWPRAVLSLGWITRPPPPHTDTDTQMAAPTDAHYYSDAHVSAMVSLVSAAASASPSSPFPQCTFPVRASLVRGSWSRATLQRLLAACPHSSLTVWTSREEQQRTGATDAERWIEDNLPTAKTFIDLHFD